MAATSAPRLSVNLPRAKLQQVQDIAASVRSDGWLIAVIACLCAFGLVMVYSASDVLGFEWFGNTSYFLQRQMIGLGLGIAGMAVVMRIDYHHLYRIARPLAIMTFVMLLLVLVPHVGTARNGAYRWFSIASFSIQPSAIAAVVAIVVFSRWLSERAALIKTWRGVRDYFVLLLGLVALVLLEKDMGSSIVIATVGVALLIVGGIRKRHLGFVVATLAVIGWGAVTIEPYRIARILSFSNPFADPLNSGLQLVQSLYAFGSGGITGVGLGNSIQKYQWLPEAHTDFIFAIIGEELGLAGTLSVLAAFTFLAWRGIRAALRAPDSFGVLLGAGITLWVIIQAFINIGAVSGLIPTTGIPLPFISYGGTSLTMTMVAMGILCNISAQGRIPGASRRAYVDRWGRHGGTSDPGSRARRGAARG